MKKALKVLLVIVIVVVAAILALPLWIGPVATGIANTVAPGKLKTEFNLGRFALNPYTGHLGVGRLTVANPKGYFDPTALTLGDLSVDVEVGSLFGDTIVIKEIVIRDVYTSYVKNGAGKYNVDEILENVQGGAAAEDAKPVPSADGAKPQAAEPTQAESAKEETANPEKTDSPKQETAKKPGKKVIIDHVRVEGVKVKWGFLTIPVPTIDLTGIGRSSGGVDWVSAWNDVRGKVLEACGAAGANLKDLGLNLKDLGIDTGKLATKLGADGVDKLGEAVKAIKLDQGADAAKESLKDAGEALKGLFK